MAGDLVIEGGNLEVLRDRTRDLSGRLQSVTVATAGDYISFGTGRSGLAGQERGAGDTIDEAVIVLTRDLDNFSQSANGSINEYATTEDDAIMNSQQVRHGGPTMTMDDLLRMGEEQ